MRAFVIVLVLVSLLCGGCKSPDPDVNPSFPTTLTEARDDLRRMADAPPSTPSLRPVVVVGGYADPGIGPNRMRSSLERLLGPDTQVIAVDVGFAMSMESARQRVMAAVAAAFPSDDESSTIEVDVVAISMGGLVARSAAMPREGERRLHIARLFTVSTPHRGARLAAVPTLEPRVYDMRAGSDFLNGLDAQTRDYEIVPYARLGDMIVGEANAAPTGMTPWWVKPPGLQASHLWASADPRILADIARRLRGEEPLTHEPAASLPGG